MQVWTIFIYLSQSPLQVSEKWAYCASLKNDVAVVHIYGASNIVW